jgi:hypothetical protein
VVLVGPLTLLVEVVGAMALADALASTRGTEPKTVNELKLMVDRLASYSSSVSVTACVLFGPRPPWKYRIVSPMIHQAEALRKPVLTSSSV